MQNILECTPVLHNRNLHSKQRKTDEVTSYNININFISVELHKKSHYFQTFQVLYPNI